MGIKYIVLSAALLAACSSSDATTGSAPPTDGSPEFQGSDGSQTGGEGSIDGCRRVSVSEIDAEQARQLDFPVEQQLALFEQSFEAPFHLGDLDCAALPASADGQLQIRASLLGIDRELFESAVVADPDLCPTWRREQLKYRAVIELTTDDGTLAGSFDAVAFAAHPQPGTAPITGLAFSGSAPLANFSGELGIRVDPARAHVGRLTVNVALGTTPWVSRLFTLVDYTDGGDPLQDQGDGLFWPADHGDLQNQGLCGWLDAPAPQRAAISIDDYNAL